MDAAKTAFVKLLLQLAATYGVVLALTRDSPAAAATAAFRKVLLKVHPDKGGSGEHQKALNSARESWEQAIAEAPGTGKGKKRKAADADGQLSRQIVMFATTEPRAQTQNGASSCVCGVFLGNFGVAPMRSQETGIQKYEIVDCIVPLLDKSLVDEKKMMPTNISSNLHN